MNVQHAYNKWADQYDTNQNRTRDLEAISLRNTLQNISFENCLEIGCGTGKNTQWILTKAMDVMAIDLSEEMLAKARAKITAANVQFVQADIMKDWSFATGSSFDMAIFSLVLEHIDNLDNIFEKLGRVMISGGYVYIGELHPFKQYKGSKARFETEKGVQVVSCFNHHISDFTTAASKHGFSLQLLNEYFDEDDREEIPRILTLLLKKC